jgi:PEGA domain-containing protein
MMRRPLLAFLALVLAAPASASGEERPRSVAVLEFRAGATGAHNLAARAAQLLRKATSHPVLDPDDARRIAGARIDDAVARCSGEPRCVSAIGQKLGADEVLLVGVSDLGDVIVAFQRVDSRSAAVTSRVADSLSRGSEPDDAALDAWLRRLYPREDFLRWGTLRVDADVAGAAVQVAGRSAGITPLPPLRLLAPQKLELRVAKPGYQDFVARVDLPADGEIAVRAVLVPRPVPAWYTKPWVWAVVGGVVAAGVATAIIVAQPAPTSVPVTVQPGSGLVVTRF